MLAHPVFPSSSNQDQEFASLLQPVVSGDRQKWVRHYPNPLELDEFKWSFFFFFYFSFLTKLYPQFTPLLFLSSGYHCWSVSIHHEFWTVWFHLCSCHHYSISVYLTESESPSNLFGNQEIIHFIGFFFFVFINNFRILTLS